MEYKFIEDKKKTRIAILKNIKHWKEKILNPIKRIEIENEFPKPTRLDIRGEQFGGMSMELVWADNLSVTVPCYYDCPLCKLHSITWDKYFITNCSYCPVTIQGNPACTKHNSLWAKFIYRPSSDTAIEMINLFKSLLDEKET